MEGNVTKCNNSCSISFPSCSNTFIEIIRYNFQYVVEHTFFTGWCIYVQTLDGMLGLLGVIGVLGLAGLLGNRSES